MRTSAQVDPSLAAAPGAAAPRVHARLGLWGALGIALCLGLWASAFVGIRSALQAYPPGQLALLRFTIGSVTLGLYALVTRMRLIAWRDVPPVAAAGILGIGVYQIGLCFGEMTVPAGTAALLIVLQPVFVAVLARFMLREHFGLQRWAGTLVSLCGVTLLALRMEGGLGFDGRALLIVMAAAAGAVQTVLLKKALHTYGPLQVTTIAMWAGTAVMLIFAPGLPQTIHAAPWPKTLTVVYLGVCPAAIAYLLWNVILQRMPAGRASSFNYLIPAMVFIMAWLYLGEQATPLALLGGALVIAGVAVVNARSALPPVADAG